MALFCAAVIEEIQFLSKSFPFFATSTFSHVSYHLLVA